MLEAYASIVAGLGLGYVALRTRSIWSGFLVHVLVAMTMDILAVTLGPA
jgi:membrane protease YdiL (CAAX protease family)